VVVVGIGVVGWMVVKGKASCETTTVDVVKAVAIYS